MNIPGRILFFCSGSCFFSYFSFSSFSGFVFAAHAAAFAFGSAFSVGVVDFLSFVFLQTFVDGFAYVGEDEVD